jgi:hypothetical protein
MNGDHKLYNLFEISKSELIELISKLDDIEDAKTLSSIETHLRRSEVDDNISLIKKQALSNLDSKSWDFFNRTINSKHFGYKSLKEYFVLLNDPSMKIGPSHFEKSGKGSILELVPSKMRSNEVFQETLPDIMQYSAATASGQGAGELFFLIYGLNASKVPSAEGADVSLDGWYLEIKSTGSGLKSSASDEKAGQGAESRVADTLNDGLKEIANKNGWQLEDTDKSPRLTKGWFPEFWKKLEKSKGEDAAVRLMNDYISKIYKVKDSSEMARKVLKSLGSSDADKVWSSSVVNMNKANSGWDSVLIINTKNVHTLEYCNFVDGDTIPDNAAMQPVLSRGRGTFAYPDGYIALGLKGARTGEEMEIRSQKRQDSLKILAELKDEYSSLFQAYKSIRMNLPPKLDKKFEKVFTTMSSGIKDKTKELQNADAYDRTLMKGMVSSMKKMKQELEDVGAFAYHQKESTVAKEKSPDVPKKLDIPKAEPAPLNKKVAGEKPSDETESLPEPDEDALNESSLRRLQYLVKYS